MDAASTRSFARQDAIFARSTQFFALLVLFTLLAIVGSLIYGAWPTITQIVPHNGASPPNRLRTGSHASSTMNLGPT